MMGDNRDNSNRQAVSSVRSDTYRSRISSAGPRSSSSRPGRRACLGSVDLAVERALGEVAEVRTMSPRPSAKLAPALREGSGPSAGADFTSPPVAADSRPPAASKTKRPRRRASVLETRVGYRFADPALARPGPHPYFRLDRRTQTAPAAISGSNSSATMCSAWWFPTCFFALFRARTRENCHGGSPICAQGGNAPTWRA